MKILIAPNSFKESLNSTDIAKHIGVGLKKASRKFEVLEFPLADGGTGTCYILTKALNGKFIKCIVTGPFNKKVSASYGYIPQQKTAIIELAEAAGLKLISKNRRNPLLTTTSGVGELMLHALKRNCKKIILGIGDSATIDCGVGALSVLGVRFLNKANAEIEPNCRGLLDLSRIDVSRIDEKIKKVTIIIASDVDNILTGKNGALVYARQKGAQKRMIPVISRALRNFKRVFLKQYGVNVDQVSGSGAAGGIGGAMKVLLNAEIKSGFEIVKKIVSLEKKIRHSDIIITGEGTIDKQSFYGKVTKKVADIAYKYNKPVIFIAGRITKDAKIFDGYDVIGYYSILKPGMSLKRAIQNTPQLLEKIAYIVGKNLQS